MSGIGDIIDAVVGVADFATSFSDDYGYRGYGNPYNAPGFSEEDKKHVAQLREQQQQAFARDHEKQQEAKRLQKEKAAQTVQFEGGKLMPPPSRTRGTRGSPCASPTSTSIAHEHSSTNYDFSSNTSTSLKPQSIPPQNSNGYSTSNDFFSAPNKPHSISPQNSTSHSNSNSNDLFSISPKKPQSTPTRQNTNSNSDFFQSYSSTPTQPVRISNSVPSAPPVIQLDNTPSYSSPIPPPFYNSSPRATSTPSFSTSSSPIPRTPTSHLSPMFPPTSTPQSGYGYYTTQTPQFAHVPYQVPIQQPPVQQLPYQQTYQPPMQPAYQSFLQQRPYQAPGQAPRQAPDSSSQPGWLLR